MTKNKDLQNDFQKTIEGEPLSLSAEVGAVSIVGKYLKRFIYITGLAGIGLFVNACTATGYVASEPTYVESVRPERPSALHVWIDGDWIWSRHSHSYVRKEGHWQRQNQDRAYVPGHWQSTPQGNYWVTGHWQRDNH